MRCLRRKAETGIGFQLAPWVDAGQDHVHAEAVEEDRVEREERVREERSRDPDAQPIARCRRPFFSGVRTENHFRPLSHQVRRRSNVSVPLPRLFVQAAAPAKGEAPAADLETVDAAMHAAGLADEAARRLHLRRGQRKQVRSAVKPALGPREGKKCHAERPHQFRVGRDHDRAVHAVRKGMAHGAVQRYTALQEHLFAHGTRALDLGEIVCSNGVDQAGHNVFTRLALLEGDADVGIDERRAGRLELHRRRLRRVPRRRSQRP